MSTSIYDIRAALQKNGYWPIPVKRNKIPAPTAWQQLRDVSDDTVRGWDTQFPYAQNSGVLTEITPALDIDVRHPEAAQACADAARDWAEGIFVVRTGLPPKRAVLFRTERSFPKIKRRFRHPTDAPDADEHLLEFLSDGQQVVVHGIHPDTKAPYVWKDDLSPLTVARVDLPEIDEAGARELMGYCADILIQQFGFIEITGQDGKINGHHNGVDRQNDDDRPAFDPFDVLEDMEPNGGDVNDKQPRAILSLLQRGYHPDEVLQMVVDATMAKDVPAGWTRKEEEDRVRKRINSALNKLHREFDPTSGEVPAWLPPEHSNEWASILLVGYKPVFHRSNSGWIVRRGTRLGKKQSETRTPIIYTSGEFVASYRPPEYLVQGLVQRGFIYSLTGITGHGKTAITLRLAAAVGLGGLFGERPCKQGAVYYLAGENPEDVKTRWIGLAHAMQFDPDAIDVRFIPGIFPIADLAEVIREDGTQPALIIVDTSAAYFRGNDENSNTQLGNHAREMRHQLTALPGRPCVIVTNHPTKNPNLDNLIPRGGGAYVNEVDGNLVIIKNGDVTTIDWQVKFRGAPFEPFSFEIKAVIDAPKLMDANGQSIPTVIAEPLDELRHADLKAEKRDDNWRVLALLYDVDEGADPPSLAEMARQIGWVTPAGNPNKQRARHACDRLKRSGNVRHDEDFGWQLTEPGKRAAEKAKARLGL
jgi:hypothetical protein